MAVRPGDLIFVRPSFNASSPLDSAILAVGNATIYWLRKRGILVPTNETSVHVAIVLHDNLTLIEATPPAVRRTSWKTFVSDWPGATFYHAALSEPLRQYGRRAAQLALTQLGVPYSSDFSPPPRKFYCSSLVDWAYTRASANPHALVPRTPDPFRLIFVPHDFWDAYYKSLNLTLPPANTTGTNPTLLLHSPHVKFAKMPPSPPPLLSIAFDGPSDDMRRLSVSLGDDRLWPPGTLRFLQGGRWYTGDELRPDGGLKRTNGKDDLGSFSRVAASFTIGSGATIELAVRSYGHALVFEQSLPKGLNATSLNAAPPPAVTGLAPLTSWPSFDLKSGASVHYGWRSWHGTYGSYSGVGLLSNNSLVFNGVPTMPVLFRPTLSAAASSSSRSCLMVSPLNSFKVAAHAASKDDGSWRHGPSSRFPTLPPGHKTETLLLATSNGPTETVHTWGQTMQHLHKTDRSEALSTDPLVNKLGYWTDNGAYYNFNKWAGNTMPGYEWNPRKDPSKTPERMLTAVVKSLRKDGIRPGYMQLDDWYYDGVVYEGAVSCVREWVGRSDWFPSGLDGFSSQAGVPLLLYMPYLCNDTNYRKSFNLSTEPLSKDKHGGVPDAPNGSVCPWPQNKSCVGRYSLPSPEASRSFYSAMFKAAKASQGMVAFEHDFVGQDSLDFGWTSVYNAGSQWLQGLGKAAESLKVPMQLCLVTASDLLESLTMPWVTNARASGDYAFCADSWDIGDSGMLHWAVGVRPFKDVFWSRAYQEGSPYENTTLFPSMYKKCRQNPEGVHKQPNVQIDALVSAFSTGPVGIGDGLGHTDANLVLSTCRADGVLLHPSKPLSPLDRTWWPSSSPKPPSWLLGSYSHVGGGSSLWQYVVAIDSPCESTPPIAQDDLYWPAASISGVQASSHAVIAWGASCKDGEKAYTPDSCVSKLDATHPTLHACTMGGRMDNGTHSWSLYTLAPILEGGWALLGEANKFVRASQNRFESVDGTESDVLRLVLLGMVGEVVRLLVVTPSAILRVVEVEMKAARMGWNVSAH